jgi:hypothetical protein
MTHGYSLTFHHRPYYLAVLVEGPEDSLAVSLAYWSEIAVECRRHLVRRLLVLEKLETSSNSEDASRLIAELPNMGLGDIRIAFVDTTESVDLMVHFELEGRKAGLVGHVFGNEAAAVEWLLSDTASGSVVNTLRAG